MLDEYMKQLEEVIDKDEYDRSNFEEKILKREKLLSETNEQNNEDPETTPFNEKLLQSDRSKKVKNNNNLPNRPAWGSNTLNNKKNPVRESYKQSKVINYKNINNKVEEKKKKNLNLKKQREKIKQKHNELEKELNNKEDELNKVTKEKEDLSKYLFKIEKVVKGASNTAGNPSVMTFSENEILQDKVKNYEAFDSQSLTINISGGSPNIIMENEKGEKIIIISKKDLMKYLNKLYKENQGLKNFQNQIFNLSKSYDDINNNLADCIAGFQELCINNPSDKINMQDVNEKINELKKHIETSLETKMNEYSILNDKRDEDLSLLNSEFIELEKEMKDGGSDRFEEQRKIMELQIKKEELERQIEELEGKNEKINEE